MSDRVKAALKTMDDATATVEGTHGARRYATIYATKPGGVAWSDFVDHEPAGAGWSDFVKRHAQHKRHPTCMACATPTAKKARSNPEAKLVRPLRVGPTPRHNPEA